MNWRSLAFASAAGLLLAASFPSIDIPLFAWIALVPLILALNGQTVRNALLLGGVCGIVYFAGTVYWVAHAMHEYGNLAVIPSAAVTLILCAYLAFYPALFAAALAHIGRHRSNILFLAAPALWTSLELARTLSFGGFPWALLGYSQYTVLPIIQVADITGVYGVSFLIVFFNSSLATFLDDRKQLLPLGSALVLTAIVLGYGWLRLAEPDLGPGIRISVIQGNIEQDRKWNPAYQRETFAVYQRLTREALKEHPDLVIWPETATPFYFGGGDPAARTMTTELSGFVKANKIPLLFGSATRGPALPAVLHNSAFLLSPDGTVAGSYRKLHLVPFGEYVPFKKVLLFAGKMVQTEEDFEPGRDYSLMPFFVAGHKVPINTVICYEIIFPDLVRRFVQKGSRIITTITNDAWFGETAAPYQHFSMAVFRAVENRVPVARAANTGISGFIDAKGHILSASGIFSEAQSTRNISPGLAPTLYTAYGDIFSYLCVLVSLAFLAKSRATV